MPASMFSSAKASIFRNSLIAPILDGGIPAVHHDVGAGKERRLSADQEKRGLGHFIRRAKAADGMQARHGLAGRRLAAKARGEAARHDRARRQTDGANPFRSVVD